MKSKSNKFAQLMRSCREQRWSLYRLEQELRRYYSDRGEYPKDGKFSGGRSSAVSWIRWYIKDERRRRIKERQEKREKAQRKLQQAVADGVVEKPQHCEHCQRHTIKRKLHGHHRDYRYALRVIWLCQSCHIRAQGKRAVKRAVLYAEKRRLQKRLDAGQITFDRYCNRLHQLATELRVPSLLHIIKTKDGGTISY